MRIHYFTHGHRASTAFWNTDQGRACLNKVGRYLAGVGLGYWTGKFEFIGSFAVGIPLNQTSEEQDEEDFALAYGVSTLYHVAPSLQALVEVHGESVFGAEDVSALYVSPGVTFQPYDDKSVSFGVGVTLPVTDDRDFDYAINLMSILHF